MPYKTGKLKGELLVSEIRKLVRLHNKLSKIKIPPRSSRDDIIKIVEDNGYKIDHKNQKLTATRMNKDLTLKEAQETFPVKKRVKKETAKPAEKPKPKKEDEVRPAEKPFPPKIKIKIKKEEPKKEEPTPKKEEPIKEEPKKEEPTPKEDNSFQKKVDDAFNELQKNFEFRKKEEEKALPITEVIFASQDYEKDILKNLVKGYSTRYKFRAKNNIRKEAVIERENQKRSRKQSGEQYGGKQEILTLKRTDLDKFNKDFKMPNKPNILKEAPKPIKKEEPKKEIGTTPKKAEPKKAEPKKKAEPRKIIRESVTGDPDKGVKRVKKDLTPIINQRVTIAENNFIEDYNNLIIWFKKNEKKKFIYPLELTSFFPNKFNDENYEAVIGSVRGFIEIYAVIAQDIIDNNDLDLKIKRTWDKAPKKMKKKYVDNLGRDAKKEGIIDITTKLASVMKEEPKKAEPKKTTVNFDEIEQGLEDMDDEINTMTAEIRGSSKYSLKKANFTEKEIFSESKFKNMKDLESQFRILKDKASNVTDDDQRQVARNLIENITDRLPFVKDNIK